MSPITLRTLVTNRAGLLIGFLFLIVSTFQGCTGCSGTTLQFSNRESKPTETETAAGDGRPFEGKPDPGVYYVRVPGFKCAGQDAVPAHIEIKAKGITETRLNPEDCSKKETNLNREQIDYTILNKDLIGFSKQIYERSQAKADPPDSLSKIPEAFCLSSDRSQAAISVVVSGTMSSMFSTAQVKVGRHDSGSPIVAAENTYYVTKRSLGPAMSFRGAQFSLVIDRTATSPAGLYFASLDAEPKSETANAKLICRVGSLWDTLAPAPLQFAAETLAPPLSSMFSFVRSSTASYLDSNGNLRVAPANSPRFYSNLTTGRSAGLIVESSAENILLQSEDLLASPWLPNGAVIVSDQELAPTGARTAEFVREGVLNGSQGFAQHVNVAAGRSYTFSVYVKLPPQDASPVLQILVESIRNSVYIESHYDLKSEQAFTASSGPSGLSSVVTSSLERIGNGWLRLRLSGILSPTATTWPIALYLKPTPTTQIAHQGDGKSGLLIWGAQFEEGPVPTSYIPTTNSAAARAADLVSLRDVHLLNGERGAIVVDAVSGPHTASQADATKFLLFTGVGVDGGVLSVSQVGSSVEAAVGADSARVTTWSAPLELNSLLRRTIGLSFQPGEGILVMNGATSVAPRSIAPPVNFQSFWVGSDAKSSWNGVVRGLRYWSQPLTADHLESLTSGND